MLSRLFSGWIFFICCILFMGDARQYVIYCSIAWHLQVKTLFLQVVHHRRRVFTRQFFACFQFELHGEIQATQAFTQVVGQAGEIITLAQI